MIWYCIILGSFCTQVCNDINDYLTRPWDNRLNNNINKRRREEKWDIRICTRVWRKKERTKKKRNSEMARRRWAVPMPRGHIALSKGQIRRHTRNVYVRFCCCRCFFFRFELGKGICEQVAEWGMWFKSNAGLSCCRLSRFTTDVVDIVGRYKKRTSRRVVELCAVERRYPAAPCFARGIWQTR